MWKILNDFQTGNGRLTSRRVNKFRFSVSGDLDYHTATEQLLPLKTHPFPGWMSLIHSSLSGRIIERNLRDERSQLRILQTKKLRFSEFAWLSSVIPSYFCLGPNTMLHFLQARAIQVSNHFPVSTLFTTKQKAICIVSGKASTLEIWVYPSAFLEVGAKPGYLGSR